MMQMSRFLLFRNNNFLAMFLAISLTLFVIFTDAVTAQEDNYQVRSDIPWTKDFHNVDGYDQFPGNCRGGLMAQQSCVYCTLHDCAAACTRLTNCVGFSYILDENRCLLKKNKCLSPDVSDRVHYYDKTAASALPPKVSHDYSGSVKMVEEGISSDSGSFDNKIFPGMLILINFSLQPILFFENIHLLKLK